MNFNHEKLMLMMLYNTGTRLGLIHGVAVHAMLPDARRNCPAGAVGGRYRKAEPADRCGVCRTGISPGLIIAAYGRRTYPLLYQSTM